jgi:hypothetical protein
MYCQKCWSNEPDSAVECSKCGAKFAKKKAVQESGSSEAPIWILLAQLSFFEFLPGCLPALIGCLPWIVGLVFVLGFLSRYYYFK